VERGIATLADLDRAIELNADYVEAYEQRARKRMEAGDLAGAVADMDRAVEISPGNQALLQLRAEVRRAKVGATTGPAR
jgi:tetratricopeptide (TPR) repeat protein